MKKILLLLFCLSIACKTTTKSESQITENQEEFIDFIQQLKSNYIYLDDKKEIINCIAETYVKHVDTLTSSYYKVLFYETILNELYDSHVNLNTNTDKSYRLSSPLYVTSKKDGLYIKNVFASELETVISKNIIGAEILAFNEVDLQEKLDAFPTRCHDKTNPEIKEWLANKILAGKRNEPRSLSLQLKSGEKMSLNLDSLQMKQHRTLLGASITNNIGMIRIHNSLGNSELVEVFDEALDDMLSTKALILDLRNTPGGGNTSVAEPIMGRFISEKQAYQVCENTDEKYSRYVTSRGQIYSKPVYVLAGRWTGSMGEGITIGFDGMQRATIVGTELNRLAGGMKTIKLKHSNFGFRISFEKMYHVNGALRETFVPETYVTQQEHLDDEFLGQAIDLILSRP